MSFLLFSGALLTLHPIYPIQAECEFPHFRALTRTFKSEELLVRAGLPQRVPANDCANAARGIDVTGVAEYQSFWDNHAASSLRRSAALEQTQPFSAASILKVAKQDDEASGGVKIEEESSALTEEDKVNQAEDGEAGSSVFSVMNATIPTSSAEPPVWRPLFSKKSTSGNFLFPLTTDKVVTSPYGLRYHPVIHSFMRHEGTDFRAALNSEVMAIADGVVVETGYGPVTGFYVTVRHADGWSSRYLHLNQLLTAKNHYLQKGNVLGLSGNTGRTNGPHLHLEVSHNHQMIDPMTIDFEQRSSVISADELSAPASEVETPAPAPAPEPIDMTPKISIIIGEGKTLQVGVRIGRKMEMYSPQEIIETEEGAWRIVSKFGKYKLRKIDAEVAKTSAK